VLALLLSEPPAWTRGYAIGVRYESASQLAQIGGDFYDVVEVGQDGLAFIIADARGKGLEASSLAAVLKGAFRSLAGEGAGPGRILTRLDRLVRREGEDEDFVTALVGRVHADGRLTLASAGHPIPFGAAPALPRVGAPLGLGDSPPEGRGRLMPGDRLICFTDGLVEARDPDGEFIDQTTLKTTLTEERLEVVLDRLVELVTEHVQGRLGDDLALLGLDYDPDGPSPAGGA
jgi:phosphoserine phosphatase RsbU/P